MPVRLAEQLDELAYRTGARRSDVMREALTRFVAEQIAPVPRDEAEHALDVLRRIVAKTTGTAGGAQCSDTYLTHTGAVFGRTSASTASMFGWYVSRNPSWL